MPSSCPAFCSCLFSALRSPQSAVRNHRRRTSCDYLVSTFGSFAGAGLSRSTLGSARGGGGGGELRAGGGEQVGGGAGLRSGTGRGVDTRSGGGGECLGVARSGAGLAAGARGRSDTVAPSGLGRGRSETDPASGIRWSGGVNASFWSA